jgi:hypothetical protein
MISVQRERNYSSKHYSRALIAILIAVFLTSAMTAAMPITPVQAANIWYVDPSGTDDGSHGTGPGAGAFKTIQYAINDARVLGGDTINVAAGTYEESQVNIAKPLTLKGAGAATTIIDGGNAPLTDSGTVRIYLPTGPVVVDGFTIRNPGHSGTDVINLMVKNSYPVTIQNCHFIGLNVVDSNYHVGVWQYSAQSGGTITIQNNEFEKMWNGVMLEIPRAGGSVLNNTFHDLVAWQCQPETLVEPRGAYALTYDGNDISELIAINGNTFQNFNGVSVDVRGVTDTTIAKFTNVEIKDNTINAIGSGPELRHAGIRLLNTGANPSEAANGGVHNVIISGNVITGTSGADSYGIRIDGPNNHITIQSNSITRVTNGIAVREQVAGAGFASDVTAHYNNIEGNTNYGIYNGGTSTLDAENNWWGSSTGPTHSSNPAGTGDKVSDNVDFTPWLTAPIAAGGVKSETVIGSGTVDAMDEADTTVHIDAAGGHTVTVASLASNPGTGFAAGKGSIGKYVDVNLDSVADVTQVEIRLYYTDAEVAGLDESSLKMYYWTGATWAVCSNTGVNTVANYIWAIISATTTPNLDFLLGGPLGGGGNPKPPPSIGGEVYPVDKLALLTPYIAAILVIATTAVVVKRRRH